MARLFVHRPRLHALAAPVEAVHRQRFWEAASGILYVAGGVTFVAGSVFFFPALAALRDVGVWLFVVGSLIYLAVTTHDLLEVHRVGRSSDLSGDGEAVAAVTYVLGTLLFTVGSVFFLERFNLVGAGAWCFVVGSLLFVVGAGINVVDAATIDSRDVLRLFNLTAVTFLVGSVLFAVASVPYGWSWRSAADRTTVYAFLALLFTIGSVLFVAGGVCNLRRVRLFARGRGDDVSR